MSDSQVTSSVPSTRSVAIGVVQVTTAPSVPAAGTVWLAGVPRMVGGVVSSTVIVNEAVPVLPAASVAVQVTVVVPRSKRSPDSASHVTVTGPSTLSVAVAATQRGRGTVRSGGLQRLARRRRHDGRRRVLDRPGQGGRLRDRRADAACSPEPRTCAHQRQFRWPSRAAPSSTSSATCRPRTGCHPASTGRRHRSGPLRTRTSR